MCLPSIQNRFYALNKQETSSIIITKSFLSLFIMYTCTSPQTDVKQLQSVLKYGVWEYLETIQIP